jgi:hypothetical protein
MSTLLVAFLTGQSDRSRNALSPLQARFLQSLAGEGRHLFPLNFPYRESPPFRETGLLRASWNNALLTLASRRASFAQQHRPRMEALLAQHPRAFLLLGSCGLELYNNLNLPEALERRCTLVCYGPVARRLPRFAAHTLVRGRRDFLMRVPGAHGAVAVDCEHLDYLECPGFLELCRRRLGTLKRDAAELEAPGDTSFPEGREHRPDTAPGSPHPASAEASTAGASS